MHQDQKPYCSIGAFVTVAAPMSWPSAFTVSVLVSLQPEFVQEIVFTPAFVQVGSVVILPLSHLWPVAATSSVFVAVQPEFVHLNVSWYNENIKKGIFYLEG